MYFSKSKKIGLGLIFFATLQLGFFNLNSTFSDPTQNANLENIKRITRSTSLIQHEYYDPARINPRKMLEEGFFELAKEVPEVLPIFTESALQLHVGAQKIDIPLGGVTKLYDIFPPVNQAFDFLIKNYKGKVKFENMEYAFIAGMLSVLDPHSNILPPKVYEEFKTQTEGEYGGLGIVIGIKDRELTVIAPIEDTPAHKVGIQPDDKIMQIDDQVTTNMALNDAVDLMRGAPGTKVTLKIKSKNTDPHDVILTREIIIIKSVVSKLIKQDGKNFAILRIKGFQEDTYSDLEAELVKISQQAGGKIDGIVLDMRNNPGGLLDQAIMTADKFLQNGDIVLTVGANNSDEEVAVAKKQNDDLMAPMIVLINEGSASASEIVAGALKNNNRALVVGQKSFGKGSVQSLFNLRDGSSLKLTVAQYLTPGRESIQAVGIIPDVHLYPAVVTKDYYDLIEDIDFGEDKLDAHLDNTALTKKSMSSFTFSYLTEVSSDNPDNTDNNYTSKIKEDDYALKFSIATLIKTPSSLKSDILPGLKSVIDKDSADQDKQISNAIAKLNVDWSVGQTTTSPQLEVTSFFYDETGKLLTSIPAGTTVTMETAVKNTGTEPLFRVLTEINSLNPLINNKEFVFGKIAAGEEKKVKISIKVPPEIISFTEKIKLLTYTEKTLDSAQKNFVATTFDEKTPPQLAYSFVVKDGNATGTLGNKNGIPEPGEKVVLEVQVKNIGNVVSNKTFINLRNTEGKYVFLKKAREEIGVIKPNESVTKSLAFDLKSDFIKDDFAIDLFALDDDTKAGITDTLTFHIKSPGSSTPQPGQMQIAPVITISEKTRQENNKLYLDGDVTGAAALKDIAIFVKGKKVSYINLEGTPNTRQKHFSEVLTLEDGINSVVIQVREARDLQNQKSLSYVYDKEASLLTAKTGEK